MNFQKYYQFWVDLDQKFLTSFQNLEIFRSNQISEDINIPWIKATMNYIHNLINNQTFLVQNPENGEPVTPFIDVYKAKF